MEGVLMPIMYETPSEHTISKVIITRDCVENGAAPEIIHDENKKPSTLTSKNVIKKGNKKAI
jgi:ATP-dependent Clp protease ATP-binding subunit ClpX